MNESRKNEILVHRILSGKQIFIQDNVSYELKKPSLSIKLRADLLYESAYNDNLYGEFLLAEDAPNLLIELGILSWDYNKMTSRIEKSLESAKITLYRDFYDTTKRKKYKLKIQNLKQDLDSSYQRAHQFDHLTLEHYCDNIKYEYIIANTLYHEGTNNLVFDHSKPINSAQFNLLMGCISKNVLDIITYKKIARSDYWKNYWSNNKTNILDEPAKEWSEEQKTLINISCMYDKIYEHPECPKEDVINDDDALDGWMIFQKQENEKQKKEKGVDNMLSGKIKDSSEVFLMAGNREQAEDILSLNSQESLNKINNRINLVTNSSGRIKDSEIPDVKQRIIQQLKDRG